MAASGRASDNDLWHCPHSEAYFVRPHAGACGQQSLSAHAASDARDREPSDSHRGFTRAAPEFAHGNNPRPTRAWCGGFSWHARSTDFEPWRGPMSANHGEHAHQERFVHEIEWWGENCQWQFSPAVEARRSAYGLTVSGKP